MAAPGSDRGPVEVAALAALGAVALTADRVEQLVDALAERGGLRRDEARTLVEDVIGGWRGEAVRWRENAASSAQGWLRELGLITRDEFEELELRVAQLEHRLRLLETPRPVPPAPQR